MTASYCSRSWFPCSAENSSFACIRATCVEPWSSCVTLSSHSTSLSLGRTTSTSQVCSCPKHLPEVKCVWALGPQHQGLDFRSATLELHDLGQVTHLCEPQFPHLKNGDNGTQLKRIDICRAWMQLISIYYSISSGPPDEEGPGVPSLHSKRNPRLPMVGCPF